MTLPPESIAATIQAAVAPVFLLAGISGLLVVLTTRLGRIIDRARVVQGRIPHAHRDEQRELLHTEASALWRRIRIINWSIRLCVGGALMICLVVVMLFLAELVELHIDVIVAVLFAGAMLLVISGLLLLLKEVSISTNRMREGIEATLEEVLQDVPAPGDRK